MWRDLKVQKELPKRGKQEVLEKDGLDELMASLGDPKSENEKTKREDIEHHESVAVTNSLVDEIPLSEDEKEAFAAIEKLRQGLADPSVVEIARETLCSIPVSQFLEYYKKKTFDLANYTVAHESTRNLYIINQCALSDKDIDQKRDQLNQFRTSAQYNELLLALANQSIFADTIIALTNALGPHNRVGASFSNRRGAIAKYELIDSVSLEASLELECAIPVDSTINSSIKDNRLLLATVQSGISIYQKNNTWHLTRTVHRPLLEHVFDNETKHAARSLIKNKAAGPVPVVKHCEKQSIIGAGRVFSAAARSVDALSQLVRRASSEECDSSIPPPSATSGNDTEDRDRDISALLASRLLLS